MLCCSYTLAGLLELADISMPEDFEEEEWEVVITGLQNRSHKVYIQHTVSECHTSMPWPLFLFTIVPAVILYWILIVVMCPAH